MSVRAPPAGTRLRLALQAGRARELERLAVRMAIGCAAGKRNFDQIGDGQSTDLETDLDGCAAPSGEDTDLGESLAEAAPSAGSAAVPPPLFAALCRCLEALEWGPGLKRGGSPPTPAVRTLILRRFFELHVPVDLKEQDRLLILLLPSEDRRRHYLSQAKIAAAVARLRMVDAEEAQSLASAESRGLDFGETLRRLVRQQAPLNPLTTADVDSYLTRHADGDKGALEDALSKVGPLEAKWLARLFLRNLKIGAESWVNTDPRKLTLVKLVMEAYSHGMFDFYLHRGDMQVAARMAKLARARRLRNEQPVYGLPNGDTGACFLDPSLVLGTYVAVQNATPVERLDEFERRLGQTTMLSVAQKHDGERLQLHVFRCEKPDVDPTKERPLFRRGGFEYVIFSRGGNNSTFRRALALPPIAAALGRQRLPYEALWEPHRAALQAAATQPRPLQVESAILDAEIVVYDQERGKVEEFGFVQSMAPSPASKESVRTKSKNLMVLFFDVLQCNDRDLVKEGSPLREREALLRQMLAPVPGFVEIVQTEHVAADDKPSMERMLAEVVRAKQEGLVVKKLDAPYVPNGREHWFKLKPAAICGLGDTLTVGLVGVRLDHGVNEGKIASFALGAVVNINAVLGGEEPRWAWLFSTPIVPPALRGPLTELCSQTMQEGSDADWLQGAPTRPSDQLHKVAKDPRTGILAVEVSGQSFVRASGSFGGSGQSRYELRFPKITSLHSATPGDALARVVGLLAYQAAGRKAAEDCVSREWVARVLRAAR